ncbi:MAG: ABC transporter permease subunit [Paracoccaceae bacterium]
MLAAVYRNTWIDNLLRIVSLIGVVTPGFVLAILLQLIAAHTSASSRSPGGLTAASTSAPTSPACWWSTGCSLAASTWCWMRCGTCSCRRSRSRRPVSAR